MLYVPGGTLTDKQPPPTRRVTFTANVRQHSPTVSRFILSNLRAVMRLPGVEWTAVGKILDVPLHLFHRFCCCWWSSWWWWYCSRGSHGKLMTF